MTSATFDTSVYVRALHFGGPAALLLGRARAGLIRIDISDPILNETIRVLRDKFQWDGYMLQDARAKLLSIANRVSPNQTLSVVDADPDDNRVVECAVTANSDYIVSEDDDLLRLVAIGRTPVVTVRDFVRLSVAAPHP